jgi:hypothetical protein
MIAKRRNAANPGSFTGKTWESPSPIGTVVSHALEVAAVFSNSDSVVDSMAVGGFTPTDATDDVTPPNTAGDSTAGEDKTAAGAAVASGRGNARIVRTTNEAPITARPPGFNMIRISALLAQ